MPSSRSLFVPAPSPQSSVQQVRAAFQRFPDVRKGGNNQSDLVEDAALRAFAVFFTLRPSFLDYQKRMQQERGRNYADSLLGVHQIPTTQQIKTLLDPISPRQVFPLFIDTMDTLRQCGELGAYRSIGGSFLIARDGTEHFCSETISCPCCSTRDIKVPLWSASVGMANGASPIPSVT